MEKTALFGDQKPAPPLGNLATHIRTDHKGEPAPSHVHPGEIRGVGAASSKIMEDFIIDGHLNPIINSTQSNFLKIFAAWIVEDDLAFTTGETEGINRLFHFLHTRYQLPSDTTVRNTLAEMYIDMYKLVKSELAVRAKALHDYSNVSPEPRTSNLSLPCQRIHGQRVP